MDYMQKESNFTIKFKYEKDYKDILEGFKQHTIDMAYLGPLPFAILMSQYPHVKPIISFRQKDGSVKYRCVISKYEKDELDLNVPIKVALTQPLSTCGYFMTKQLLQKRYGIPLENQLFKYTMSHTNALLGVLQEKFLIAGSSEDIAMKHESLGMQIIEKSELLPGFAIVVNTQTLKKEEIDAITQTLLLIPKSRYAKWGNKMAHGMVPADEKSYESLFIDYSIPNEGNMP